MQNSSRTMQRAKANPLPRSAAKVSRLTSETTRRLNEAAERLDRVRQAHARNPHCIETYIRYLECQVDFQRWQLRQVGVTA